MVISLFDLDQQYTFWLFLTNSKLLDLILLDAKLVNVENPKI